MSAIKLSRSVGTLLLATWLILTGLIPLLSLSIAGLGTLMAILALLAGIFLAIGR